jgi:hypothetical protein
LTENARGGAAARTTKTGAAASDYIQQSTVPAADATLNNSPRSRDKFHTLLWAPQPSEAAPALDLSGRKPECSLEVLRASVLSFFGQPTNGA